MSSKRKQARARVCSRIFLSKRFGDHILKALIALLYIFLSSHFIQFGDGTMAGVDGANSNAGGSRSGRGRGVAAATHKTARASDDHEDADSDEVDPAESQPRGAKIRNPHNMTFIEAVLASEVRRREPLSCIL